MTAKYFLAKMLMLLFCATVHKQQKKFKIKDLNPLLRSVCRRCSCSLHLVCFISNAYKQRFFQRVEIFENLSNTTGWNSKY